MKILESNLIRMVLSALFLGIIYKTSQTTLPPLQALPVYGINNATQQTNNSDSLKNLYPLVAHHNKAPSTATTSDIINVDNAFIPLAAIPESTQSKTPDYFILLKDNNILTLQAITNNGAIINNRYYAYSTPLIDFAYPNQAGKNISPTLMQATSNNVLIYETPGKRRFNLTLNTK